MVARWKENRFCQQWRYLPRRFGRGLRRRVLQRRFSMQRFGIGELTLPPHRNRVFLQNDRK